MKNIRSFAFLIVTLLCTLIATQAGPLTAAALWCVATVALAPPVFSPRLCITLTTAEVLLDVIDAFVKKLPFLRYMGNDWRPSTLKLNQTYTAHVPSVPTVESVASGDYSALTGQTARSLLTDVGVTVDEHPAVKLKWQHIDAIKDNKNEYDKVIALAGYALAKHVIDNIIAGMTPTNFSQVSNYAVADSDCDMLDNICGDLNLVGAIPTGRFGIVNTPVATVLAGDSRLTSRDYADQRVRGEGYRRWVDTNGFSEIVEYPDLSNTTSGAALTAVTVANTGDLFTKAAHGLSTGQTVTAASFSAGFSDGTYYVIRVSASTFQLASSHANALAGTAVAASADGTGGVITPTQTLTGFFGESRAITLLGGIPDGMDIAGQLGISLNRVNSIEIVTHPDLGISMAAIAWEEAGKLDVNWVPTFVFGKALGRQAVANGVGGLMDSGGHRLVSA